MICKQLSKISDFPGESRDPDIFYPKKGNWLGKNSHAFVFNLNAADVGRPKESGSRLSPGRAAFSDERKVRHER